MAANILKFTDMRHSFGQYKRCTKEQTRTRNFLHPAAVGNEIYFHAWDLRLLIELITPSINNLAHV